MMLRSGAGAATVTINVAGDTLAAPPGAAAPAGGPPGDPSDDTPSDDETVPLGPVGGREATAASTDKKYPWWKSVPTNQEKFNGQGRLLNPEAWLQWRDNFMCTLSERNFTDPADRWHVLGSYLEGEPKVLHTARGQDSPVPGVDPVVAFLDELVPSYFHEPMDQYINTTLANTQQGRSTVAAYANRVRYLAGLSSADISLSALHIHFLRGLPEHLQTAYNREGARRTAQREAPINTLPLVGDLILILQYAEKQFLENEQRAQKQKREHQAVLSAMTIQLNAMKTEMVRVNAMYTGKSSGSKRLTPAEMVKKAAAKYKLTQAQVQTRWDNHACFKCGQRDHRDAACPNALSQ